MAASLPDGFVLDPPPKAATASIPGLPEGFVLDTPPLANPPLPPPRPASFGPSPLDDAPEPPARPPQADLTLLNAQAKDADAADLKSQLPSGNIVQWGDKFYNPGNPAPIGSVPSLSADQGAAEKAARLDAATKNLASVSDPNNLNQFMTPQEIAAQGEYSFEVPTDTLKARQAEAIKAAKANLATLQQQPIPQNNPSTDLTNRALKGAGQSVLDVAKPFGQIGADLGAPGLQNGLDRAERALPQTDPIRNQDLSAQVAGMAGGAVPFVAGGALGAGVRTMAAAGALQGFGSQYEAAGAAGADKRTQYEAGTLGLITGAAQSLPIARLFESAAPGSSSILRNMAAQAAKGAIEFPAIQSAVTIGNNAIALGLYDKHRDLLEGVKDDAAAAALVGGFLGLGAGAANFHTAEGRAKVAEAAKNFDWAKILDVDPSATPDQVDAAFVAKINQAGPNAAAEDVQEFLAAYQVYRAGQNRAAAEQPQQSAADQPEAQAPQTPQSQQTPEGDQAHPVAPLPVAPLRGEPEAAAPPAAGERLQPPAADAAKADEAGDAARNAEDAALIQHGFEPDDIAAMSPKARAKALKDMQEAVAQADATQPAADNGQNAPESPPSLQAQQQQLVGGDRPVVMYPKGTQAPAVPEGMKQIVTPRGTFHYNPDQITPQQIKKASAQGRENEILAAGPGSNADLQPAVEPRQQREAAPPPNLKPVEAKASRSNATGDALASEPVVDGAIKRPQPDQTAKEAPPKPQETPTQAAAAESAPTPKDMRAEEDGLLRSHLGFSQGEIDSMSPARREQELQWAREEKDAPRSYQEAMQRGLADDEGTPRAPSVDVERPASGERANARSEPSDLQDRGRSPAIDPERAAHVKTVVDGLINDLLPKDTVRSEVKDRIPLTDSERQAAGVTDREALGAYDPKRRVVEIAAGAKNPDAVAVHELWHAARDLGLADKNEAAVLKRDMPRLRKFLETAYPGHEWAGLPDHEIEAYAAQAYWQALQSGTQVSLHVGIRRVFQRFFDFTNRLWNAVHGNGFQMPEDIFSRFTEGGFKDRTPGASQYPGSGRAPSVYGHDNGIGTTPKRDDAAKLDALRTKAQDFNIPVRRLGEKLEEMTGRKLSDEQNTYLAKRLIPGKVLAQHQEITRDFEDPIVRIAKEAGLTLGDIGDRLLADHAPERNAAIDDLHDWRKNFSRRKAAARAADAEASTAETTLATAKKDVEAKFLASEAKAKHAKGLADLEAKSPGPDREKATDAARASAEAARRDLADAERERNLAYDRAKKLREQADAAARYAETPMDQARNAAQNVTDAEARAAELRAKAGDAAHKVTLAEDEHDHLRDPADVEVERFDADPQDAVQKKRMEQALRTAMAARFRRREARKQARAAEAEADRAEERVHEMRATADKKRAWADAEEKRRDDSFGRIKGKGSGITDQEAGDILAQHASDGKTEALDKIAALFRDLREHTIRTSLEGGLISPETADAWRTKYTNYADLRGFEDQSLAPDDAYFGPNGRRMHIHGEEVKQAFGRTSISNNPAVNMIEAAHRTVERAEANKAGQTLYRALSAMDPEHLEGVAKLDRGETKWTMDDKTGMAKSVDDPRHAMSPNAVSVKFNGKARYVVFDDARLAESVKRLSSEQVGEVGRMVLAYQNLAKFLWTHGAPAFMARHFLGRYPMEGMLNAGEYGFGAMARAWKSYPVFGPYYRAVRAADRMSVGERAALARKVASGNATKSEQYQAAYHEMVAEGGLMGRNFFDMENISNSLQDRLTKIGDIADAEGLRAKAGTAFRILKAKDRAFFGAMDHMTSQMDSGQRLAAYIEARTYRGESKAKAALAAREATVDFSVRGELANHMSLFDTFANTAAQTGVRMVGRAKALKWVLAGVAGAGAVNVFVNELFGGQDDDGTPFYDKLPSWQRQSNIAFLNPFWRDEKGRPHSNMIPLPYNYALPYNVGASAMSLMLAAMGISKDKKGEIFGRLLRSATEVLTPFGSDETFAMFAPTVTKPLVHVIENKAFTGADLHANNEYAGVAASEQGRLNTPGHWKFLAKVLNSASGGDRYKSGALDAYPESLREILGFAIDAQERTVSQMLDVAHAIGSGEPIDWGRVPGANVFNGSTKDYDRYDVSAFYDAKRRADQDYRALQKASREGAPITPDMIKAAVDHSQLDAAAKGGMAPLNKQAAAVSEDAALSAGDKYSHLRQIDRKKAQLAHDQMRIFRLRNQQNRSQP